VKNSTEKFGSLEEAIKYVDQLVFPGKPIPVKVSIPSFWSLLWKIFFSSPKKKISITNSKQLVTIASYQPIKRFHIGEEDILTEIVGQGYTVNMEMNIRMVETAVHEVRHRMQTEKGVFLNRMEMTELRKKLWPVLRNNSYFHHNYCENNFVEIDAIIIGEIAEKLKDQLSEKDLRDLVRCKSILKFLRKRKLSL